ncbi:MAG: CpaF/VirB11 family protein [Lachnospiraceae bacterium]|nr:CpaF/VirB11 family protein [Lachnospiraceae bacterium]
MRGDRIIVGECRGREALDMLQALNTGHSGSLSTGHANSTVDALSRLEVMVATAGEKLPIEAIRGQIASGIDVMVHLVRMRDKSRKVYEISEVEGCYDGKVVLNRLYEFRETGIEDEKVSGRWEKVGDMIHTEKLKMSGISLITEL